MNDRPKRKPVPIKVQRDVALRQLGELMRSLGFEVATLELDHDPALELRPAEDGEHVPHQHDPSCLVWRPKAEHRDKTHGRKRGESELSREPGDRQKINKAKRLASHHEDFRRRLFIKPGDTEPKTAGEPRKHRWPKRPMRRP